MAVLDDRPAASTTDGPTRMTRGFVPAFGFGAFGVYIALFTPALIGLALKVNDLVGETERAGALGLVTGVGALFALVCGPLAGRLSDRTTSRWGMRRPWMIGGVVIGILALYLVAAATSIPVVLVGWALAQVAFNAALAAVTATMPDQVPESRRGIVSGIIGIAAPVAALVGSILVNGFASHLARFLIPGALALVLIVIFSLVLKDRKLESKPADKLTAKEFFGSFIFNPRKHPDFGWVWLTKFLIFFGYAGIGTYVPYFLFERFDLPEQQVTATVVLANLVSTAFVIVSSVLGGVISDRTGSRRPLVAAAGIIMVVGLVMLAFSPSIAVVIVAEGFIGLGFGAFLSVDLALASQVLPNKKDTAKDLGVLNIANALPQSIAPAIAPAIIALGAATFIGGYVAWFLFGALISLVGSILVFRIKGVR